MINIIRPRVADDDIANANAVNNTDIDDNIVFLVVMDIKSPPPTCSTLINTFLNLYKNKNVIEILKSIETVYNEERTENKIVSGFVTSFDGQIGKKVDIMAIGNITNMKR